MIYDWNTNTNLEPGIVKDAKGFRHRHVLWVNTATGDMLKMTDGPGGGLVEQRLKVPAPVTVLFLGHGG